MTALKNTIPYLLSHALFILWIQMVMTSDSWHPILIIVDVSSKIHWCKTKFESCRFDQWKMKKKRKRNKANNTRIYTVTSPSVKTIHFMMRFDHGRREIRMKRLRCWTCNNMSILSCGGWWASWKLTWMNNPLCCNHKRATTKRHSKRIHALIKRNRIGTVGTASCCYMCKLSLVCF